MSALRTTSQGFSGLRMTASRSARSKMSDTPSRTSRIPSVRRRRCARSVRRNERRATFRSTPSPMATVRSRMSPRVKLAFEAAGGRLWINRYGYLSDAKLDAIGQATGV